jgi:putative ABC transport system substrate-binding protein
MSPLSFEGAGMKRREFIAALGGVATAWPLVAQAQQPKRIPRIGVLGGQDRGRLSPIMSFRDGLKELGYVEGQNIEIEWRWGHGRPELFPGLVSELLELKVDIIVAAVNAAMDSAKRATGHIPIIGVYITDPVGAGFVESLARPGGNITGMSMQLAQLATKGLELLKEVQPDITRAAFLRDLSEPFRGDEPREIDLAAQALGLQLQILEVHGPSEFAAAFEKMKRDQASAVYIETTTMTYGNISSLAELALIHHLPTCSSARQYAVDGCLISIGPSLTDMARRTAFYVDRILKGAKPSELPVQQPVKFDLVINLKTAKALGISVPPTLVARADEVIE